MLPCSRLSLKFCFFLRGRGYTRWCSAELILAMLGEPCGVMKQILGSYMLNIV